MHEPSFWTLSSTKLLLVYVVSRQKYAIFQFQCFSHRQHFLIFIDVWFLCSFDLTSVYLTYTVCECCVYQCVYWPFVWSWILLIYLFRSGSMDLNRDWYIFARFWICLPLLWLYDAIFARSYALESYRNSCLGSESIAGSYVKPVRSNGSFNVFFHVDFYFSIKFLVNSFNMYKPTVEYVQLCACGLCCIKMNYVSTINYMTNLRLLCCQQLCEAYIEQK